MGNEPNRRKFISAQRLECHFDICTFALAAKDANPFFVYLAYFPCATFWSLDSYFLRQEQVYSNLYQTVSKIAPSDIDFSMNAAVYEFDVDSWF